MHEGCSENFKSETQQNPTKNGENLKRHVRSWFNSGRSIGILSPNRHSSNGLFQLRSCDLADKTACCVNQSNVFGAIASRGCRPTEH